MEIITGKLNVVYNEHTDSDDESRSKLIKEISRVLNCCSRENKSKTPDFILAEYMVSCLEAFETTIIKREEWYNY